MSEAGEGGEKQGFTVPVQGGRSLQIRPGYNGECVQIAIVSTRGNVIEAVTVDAGQLPGVIGGLRRSREIADRDLMGALARRKLEASERYKAALARNPWLNGERPTRETYIRRPR